MKSVHRLQVGVTTALRLGRVMREHTVQADDFSHCGNNMQDQLERGKDMLV